MDCLRDDLLWIFLLFDHIHKWTWHCYYANLSQLRLTNVFMLFCRYVKLLRISLILIDYLFLCHSFLINRDNLVCPFNADRLQLYLPNCLVCTFFHKMFLIFLHINFELLIIVIMLTFYRHFCYNQYPMVDLHLNCHAITL